MDHDKDGLHLDNSTLADLAEKCMCNAKALFFRESDFELPNEKIIESLFSLYSDMGQPEAASGLLVFSKNKLDIELRMSSYENIQRWEDALEDYKKREKFPDKEIFFIPKLRCHFELNEWETIIGLYDGIFESQKQTDIEKKKEGMFYAAQSACYLNLWEKMEKYLQCSPDDELEKDFLSAILCIKQNKFEESKIRLKKTREVLDGKMGNVVPESYPRAYDYILKLQQVFELEEIIEMKLLKETMYKEAKKVINGGELLKEYDKKEKKLLDIWQDRLCGCEKSIKVWQSILHIRSLLFSRRELMKE